jgi:hypothetical protein
MDTFVAVVCALRASLTIGPGSTSSAATTAPMSHGLQAPRRACHLRSYGSERVEETGEALQNMLRRLRFDGKTSPPSQLTSDATVRSTGRDLPAASGGARASHGVTPTSYVMTGRTTAICCRALTEPPMIEDDILELQNDRIRALEMVVGVMAKVIDATGNNVLDELRDVIDGRLDDLDAADQLPGESGGASRQSLQLARAILDEAPSD